ncbi:MAG: TIGR03087 family PEP-CTERM/XrtA system glycosyltransferase [Candidatus Promineifilaceae bacterium]|nr:TIGR03087 family PEP-CTERM/XrtA system glycosyltransferase [Candidatus Promineifilaceae bacterium]
MRLLCLTSRLPYPPNRGDRLRAFHFLRRLSEEHELHLISFIAREEEREHVPFLQKYCRSVTVVQQSPTRSALTVAGNLWRRDPLQVLYYRSRPMQRLVDQTLAGAAFDAAYVHMFRMSPYVAHAADLYRIVDLTDVVSQEVQRSLAYRRALWQLIYRVEGRRIAYYERHVAQRFEETWLISEADRRALAAVCPDANIRVVPNGVDLQRLRPLEVRPDPRRMLFVGHLDVFHNVDAATFLAREVLPRVLSRYPDAVLELVGAGGSAAIQPLAALPGVTLTGYVEDLNGALNRAALFVAPLRFAAGVQNKVLEAMAAGRPVVTSSVANAGLGAEPGTHLLVADGAAATAEQILQLLENPHLARRLGAAGREFVARRFSWDRVNERMAAIASLIANGHGDDSGQGVGNA